MPSRRAHKKSFLGCSQCKARRVKCDERPPICGNCSRRGGECSLASGVPSSSHVSETTCPATSLSTRPPGALEPVPGPPPPPAYDSLDMLLMHRFSTNTAISLTSSPSCQKVWMHVFPGLAYESPVLMHGVLALAGLDLACSSEIDTEVKARCRTRALLHQQLGFQLFRQKLDLWSGDQVSEAARDAKEILLSYSMIMATLTFAHAHISSKPPSIDDVVELFTVTRGIKLMFYAGAGLPQDSPIIPLLAIRPTPNRTDRTYAHNLEELAQLRPTCPDVIYQEAIDILETFLVDSSNRNFDFRMVGRWLTSVSEAFIASVQARDPQALAILKHYAAFLSSMRHLWWVGNWDTMILTAVDHAIVEAGLHANQSAR